MHDPTRIPWRDGFDIAETLTHQLIDFCHAIEILGSIRRIQDPKDIDIGCVPHNPAQIGAFLRYREEQDARDPQAALVGDGWIRTVSGGDRRLTFSYSITLERGGEAQRFDIPVEIWMGTKHNWGALQWIRTGPGKTNEKLMAYLKHSRSPYRLRGMYLCAFNQNTGAFSQQISTPTEKIFLEVLGLPYLTPKDRRWAILERELTHPTHQYLDPETLAYLAGDEPIERAVKLHNPQQSRLFA